MNLILKKILLEFRSHIEKVSWLFVVAAVFAHLLLTWLVLVLAGETKLTSLHHYFYYYIVTTSTVGYGDLSPSTDIGKWFVAVIQIPFGLALFGVLLGKTGQTITDTIKRSMTGENSFNHYIGHIIIFGWHEKRTSKIIEHILADNKRIARRILLAVTDEIQHPFASNPHVDFVKLTSYTDLEQLQRVAISYADKVIVDGKDDDQTFTTSLRISKLVKTDCHISAYFNDDSKIEMLRDHCANVECSSSKSAEMLVRAMQDPGSSRVHEELLSTLYGDTQFSLVVPDDVDTLIFSSIFHAFKDNHNAIVLGVARSRIGDELELNPPLDYLVKAGDVLHYIAGERLLANEVQWQALVK